MPVAHNLAKDFPEFRDTLAQRVENDSSFSAVVDEYLGLDQRIRELEELDQPANDDALNQLRKERVLVKDRIEAQLRQA